MSTITIPKREYQDLVEKKFRYEYLRQVIEQDIFAPPPTHSRKEMIKAFRATGKYNQKFLASLEQGLKRSSYFHS